MIVLLLSVLPKLYTTEVILAQQGMRYWNVLVCGPSSAGNTHCISHTSLCWG